MMLIKNYMGIVVSSEKLLLSFGSVQCYTVDKNSKKYGISSEPLTSVLLIVITIPLIHTVL
jgi:hypothetical protein